jgi:hypothetical protein
VENRTVDVGSPKIEEGGTELKYDVKYFDEPK